MHHWDSSHDCAVAPSPIVRTCRPDPPSKRRSNMTTPRMTASTAGPLPPRPRGENGPRPQARSAGTAERAGRNESLVDLVRFFQTQNMTAAPMASPSHPEPQPQPSSPSDTTTALPVALSPKEIKSDPKQELKPFHRRLMQFAQRPKKESSLKSKKEEQQRQIEALAREGYLIPAPLPKDSKGQKEAKQSKESLSLSVSRSLSKSKKDVESIGQPWLEAKADGRKQSIEARDRLASLDLDDFGSMVDVAVSLASEFDDSVPPPYQPTDSRPAPTSSTVPMSSSRTDRSPSNVTEPASSLASTSHSYRNASIDEQVQTSRSAEFNNLAISQDAGSVSQFASNAPASISDAESQPRASCDSSRRDRSDQSPVRNVTPSQPTLKLFPDVAPPRKSSMVGWRTSAVPRYQAINNVAASPISLLQSGSCDNKIEISAAPQKPSDVFPDASTVEMEPNCPATLIPRAASAAATSAEKVPKESTSPNQVKARPTSLSMGTLKSFPLPAPTRPLPSLPELERSPNAPLDTGTPSVRSVRPGSTSSTLQSSTTAVPEDQGTGSAIDSPRALDSRPATALGSVDAGGSMADDEESLFAPSISDYSKSTPGLCTPKGRASSIRIPRMQELPETPGQDKGHPLADSPVLGHGKPAKNNGKRAVTGLQIDSQADRKNLPFGLPSPPPTASLPSAPPPQHPPPPPPGRKIGQRNATAPRAAKLPSMKSTDVPAGPGPYRNSMISRSDSSRSSLRNESFPDSYEESRAESRAESPLPSSDDEVFGPREDSKPSRREPDQHKRVQTVRPKYDTADANQTSSRPRLRYPQPTRSMMPQSRSNHDLEKTASSQSHYSLSAHRLRESRNSHHPRAPSAQRDHYLEDRVANLERQNQMLQAALMAALNASGKNPLEGLNLDSNMTTAFPHAPYSNQYPGRQYSRPDSWVSSSRSSDHSGFETSSSCKDVRANVMQLDNMIEDIESGWMSDKSSLSGARTARKR
jgi:hypothetical protein